MPLNRSKARAAALTLALSAPLAACGSSASSSAHSTAPSAASTTSAASPAKGRVSVAVSGYAFHPATITVAPGAKIEFTNHDQTAHTATSTKTAFDTGTLKPGQSATVTVTKPGTYTYYCQFHAFMRGTIVVK
jgi:plastocyanin